ncbi:hypothetical protein TSAR_007033 [Trichomalopsis sarcophagae]|uniref:Uncharacterized protein n=1 Tax=Trichomalopsis sarcophagae TaxID=543379 RepID=A0A232ETA5_9HYME|nr:hypothetical protein TSAR_007033 [Trichomalopsis sarcophagae]
MRAMNLTPEAMLKVDSMLLNQASYQVVDWKANTPATSPPPRGQRSKTPDHLVTTSPLNHRLLSRQPFGPSPDNCQQIFRLGNHPRETIAFGNHTFSQHGKVSLARVNFPDHGKTSGFPGTARHISWRRFT